MVTSRDGLIQYCLRDLGHPVVEINIDPQQIEDRVDEAIEFFRINHYEGIEKVYLKHEITQDDINQKSIPISDLVYGITKVYNLSQAKSTSNYLFDTQYQMRLNDLYDLSSTSLIYYQQVMNHVQLLNFTLTGHIMYRFNRLTNRLYIDMKWDGNAVVGQYILVECYRALDPDVSIKMYSEPWLKHYVTALLKKQWATNLKKFSGIQLPGGVTLNGDRLYMEATSEIKELEDEMILKSAPLDFFVG